MKWKKVLLMDEFRYNLHNHTYYSDGELSPAKVIELNKKQGYNAIAITDHDSVEGIPEAIEAGKRLGVLVIPGIEISTAKSHMLGFFVDYKNPELVNFLKQRKMRETEVANHLIQGLVKQGYPLTQEKISKVINARYLNPWNISLALVKLGFAKNEGAAIALVRKVPWLENVSKGTRSAGNVSEREAIKLIRIAKGAPVLAHPFSAKQKLRYLTVPYRAFMLKRAGLMGLEVQHPSHSRLERGFLHSVSTILSLHKTGGADFHYSVYDQLEEWKRIPQSRGVRKTIRTLHARR